MSGQIICFYSYKGGVGRSMAVANTASVLAASLQPGGSGGPEGLAKPVLIIDWDLEAPGQYAYFRDHAALGEKKGLLEFFEDLQAAFEHDDQAYERILQSSSALRDIAPLKNYITKGVMGQLDVMSTGKRIAGYRRRVAAFDWAGFWDRYPAAVRAFLDTIQNDYSFCLIDSRTGCNDVSNLCSSVMPDKLVIVFSLNQQNLDGVAEIAERSVKFRRKSNDIRPLTIFPLATRVDDAEHDQTRVWLQRFEDAFEDCFRRVYSDPTCRLGPYFAEVFIPYSAYFSYGEKLATMLEESKANSIRRAYEVFARRLTDYAYPWESEKDANERQQEDLVCVR